MLHCVKTWSLTLPSPSISYDHAGGASGVIGGKFYVTGGGTNQLDVYDPATNRWIVKAPMGSPRWQVASAVLNGKLYVIGGIRMNADGSSTTVPTTNVYDPATNTWGLKARLPTPSDGLVGTRVTFNGSPWIEVLGGPTTGNHRQYIP